MEAERVAEVSARGGLGTGRIRSAGGVERDTGDGLAARMLADTGIGGLHRTSVHDIFPCCERH